MWAHVPQTPPAVIGSMVPYPTQPTVQYQPCFIPSLQPTNHGMYFNSQVQSYSIVPQQYIPVPTNRGFRPHVGMGQPSNVPYIMHQDYVPVANSGFPHTVGGPPPLQPQTHTRPAAMYEMPSVQQHQFVPQYSKPPRHVSAFAQSRVGLFNHQAYYEHSETSLSQNILCEARDTPKLPAKSGEQCGITVVHSPQEEQLAEMNKPKTDTNTASTTTEPVPAPTQLPLIEDAETLEADVTHSPSETTLVPSPSSSDGIQTVCNSPFCPVLSDSDEEGVTAAEDDQIPTKDTGGASELTVACSSVERLEPEHPYDNEVNKESTKPCKPRPLKNDELSSRSAPSLVIQGVEGTAHYPTVTGSVEMCHSNMDRNTTRARQQSIRSLIDTPVYNSSHSRVLCQLSQSASSSSRPRNGNAKHPLTTHFRQLFKPIPCSTKTEHKVN